MATMKDVWNGDILLSDDRKLNGVSLHTATNGTSHLPQNATLRFLAVLETSRVPLYMSIGPAFEVGTTVEETESWFSSILLQNHTDAAATSTSWWQNATTDSPLGILVSVTEPVPLSKKTPGPATTELLIYAAKHENHCTARPLTPPESSPTRSDVQTDGAASLKVFALPLSSELLQHASGSEPTPPASPDTNIDIEPTFLPHTFQSTIENGEIINRPPVRKRKSATDVFDEATERKRKARRQGGQSVAAAAAGNTNPDETIPNPKHRRSISGAQVALQSRPMSRSSSVRSTKLTGLRDAPGVPKPTGLSRAESVSGSHPGSSIEQKNKDLISKMVMMGMRLFGLYQSKKTRKSRANSVAPPPLTTTADMTDIPLDAAEAAEADKKNDEDFKLIYHQVYRGTCFAMRQHMSTLSLQLHSEALRETVDRLLAVFCHDPLTRGMEEDGGQEYTPGGRKAFGSSSALAASANSANNPFLRVAVSGVDSLANTPSLGSARMTGQGG